MTGDITRSTFNRDNRYSGVRLQQGRVQLDADWNENVDIGHHFDRTGTADIIGPAGFPDHAPGFGLSPVNPDGGASGPDLLISPGRGYVAGLLCENDAATVTTLTRQSGTGTDAEWAVTAGPRLRLNQWLSDPDAPGADLVQVAAIVAPADPLSTETQVVRLATALSGDSRRVAAVATVQLQPHLPEPPPMPAAGVYAAYLDVWEREITALDDPQIREVALNGPDTATRTQVIWQVRLAPLPEPEDGQTPTCADLGPDWSPFPAGETARLRARAVEPGGEPDPCRIQAPGGYRNLENHLFRVEVHAGGPQTLGTDTVRVKWSRDNAVHRTGLIDVADGKLTVADPGKDAVTALAQEDWVEVRTAAMILAGEPGHFVRLGEVNGNVIAVAEVLDPVTLMPLEVGGEPNTGALPTTGFLRRWDGGKPLEIAPGDVGPATWITLEGGDGVEIGFSAGTCRNGDYWTIPARTLIADVEWPDDPASGEPAFQPPEGIAHHAALVGVVSVDDAGAWTVLDDCRPLFPALTALPALSYRGGDAQEATPDPADPTALLALRNPLRVGVARGSHPVESARVRFQVTTGQGRFADGSSEATVATNADGHAEIQWLLDSTTLDQHVEATLLGPDGDPDHLTITFTASLSRAAEVAFDPVNCPPLAGDRTVQAAIERLCQTTSTGCATFVLSPDADWRAVLAGLAAGEDAHLCFRRGEYRTDERIELTGLGHIVLTGAGEGTRIIAENRECALHFIDCASVRVANLAMLAPDASNPDAPIADINGVLTTTRCAHVEVTGTAMMTAASARRDRACVTIRQTRGGQAAAQTRRVLVRNNRFAVGDGQTGVLVTDAVLAVIEDNEVTGTGQVVQGDSDVIVAPGVRDTLVDRLVAGLTTAAPPPATAEERLVSAGPFVARFASFASEEDWSRATRRLPPTGAELQSSSAFEGYVRRIAGEIAADPANAPSFGRLRAAFRTASPDAELSGEAARRLLVADDRVRVEALTREITGRAVTLTVGEHRVSFDSEFSQSEWNDLLRAVGTADVSSSDSLAGVVRRTAERLVAEPDLRNRFPFARRLFDTLQQRTDGIAGQGIVCAGSRLDAVSVRGNNLSAVYEGIRVAVSHRAPADAPPDRIGSVLIAENRISLQVPLNRARGDQGIFIGNADRVVLSRNQIDFAREEVDDLYGAGAELWGHYGPLILLSENTVTNADFALKVTIEGEGGQGPDRNAVLWRSVGNLAINAGKVAFLYRTDPGTPGGGQPVPFRETDNLRISR